MLHVVSDSNIVIGWLAYIKSRDDILISHCNYPNQIGYLINQTLLNSISLKVVLYLKFFFFFAKQLCGTVLVSR